ncbi:hypothetical protein A2765_05685 [Candidatus Kaiserbacteria bacterium RIFCSPHIGHO2_01_FULL_56_24]|uniref:Uncharacterized protein n=1 Tax=Candidatus Kaiserbacteria bacterium RIFCSPHIGHO2_01_FULL_56_24 TaxID=1798487 RepID=A0A1F6DAN5_9BACT|nr:MAG: hypothetical protein A2765_05685 [Candidatus Kaiserbacteria bacterium RIFCSPHIGHO2_01_FULL_56_24]
MNKLMMALATVCLSFVPAFAGSYDNCKEVQLDNAGKGYAVVQVGRPKIVSTGKRAATFLVKVSLSSQEARATDFNEGARECADGTVIRTRSMPGKEYDVGEVALPLDQQVTIASCTSQGKVRCFVAQWDPSKISSNPKANDFRLKLVQSNGAPMMGNHQDRLGPVDDEVNEADEK